MEREKYTHPSYGMIRFSRVSGRANFFGSELAQDHYISLEVSEGELHRDLSNDWYHASHRNVLELRMTATQFAELITSLNSGSGVPCTLEYVRNEKIEQDSKMESSKEFSQRKFKERMTEFAKSMADKQAKAKELVKKKTLSKDDQHELLMHLDWLSTEISSNIPFFIECFQEQMDKIVLQAKGEVENAIMHKITSMGLEALHNENKLLG